MCLHRKHANEILVVFTVTRLRNTGFPDIFDEEDIDKESDTHVYIKQSAMTIYPFIPPPRPIKPDSNRVTLLRKIIMSICSKRVGVQIKKKYPSGIL